MGSDILNTLSGDSPCILTNEQDLHSTKPSSYTAVITGVNNVHSILPGTILFLGYYKGTGTLYISISKHEMIRYMNLKSMTVWRGQDVSKGTSVGIAYKSALLFEYCTVYQQGSPYPVRFADRTYYKQNPIDILDGIYTPYKEITLKSGIVRTNNSCTFTEEQRKEWYSGDYYSPDYGNEDPPKYFPTYNPKKN